MCVRVPFVFVVDGGRKETTDVPLEKIIIHHDEENKAGGGGEREEKDANEKLAREREREHKCRGAFPIWLSE